MKAASVSGLALHRCAGWVDVALKGKWALNFDARKVFFEIDADINSDISLGALKSGVTLDPRVVSAGAAYRF